MLTTILSSTVISAIIGGITAYMTSSKRLEKYKNVVNAKKDSFNEAKVVYDRINLIIRFINLNSTKGVLPQIYSLYTELEDIIFDKKVYIPEGLLNIMVMTNLDIGQWMTAVDVVHPNDEELELQKKSTEKLSLDIQRLDNCMKTEYDLYQGKKSA
ncbi:hypothetical protein ACEN4E_05575 [Latilactobacillus sakei]|uniref:hypothetical protein n=1 Tax=Latilactobacillus sakei TaxID=1599 RepID=UPI003889DC8E